MALKKDMKEPRFGFIVPDAYLKLAYFRWSSIDNKCVATVSMWQDSGAEDREGEVVSNIEIDVTDMFPEMAKKLYNRIKKEAEFKSAMDV